MSRDPRAAIEDLRWWHTIEVAAGVTTPGPWDLRPTAERMPWPGSLRGLRCLDVGTIDGFWAFELERRGAEEVVAIDLVDPRRQDSPASERARRTSHARLDARLDGSEWFVFNRRGLAKALEVAGFQVEQMTPTFRDAYNIPPHAETPSLATRLQHALGMRGWSVAVRARPLAVPLR